MILFHLFLASLAYFEEMINGMVNRNFNFKDITRKYYSNIFEKNNPIDHRRIFTANQVRMEASIASGNGFDINSPVHNNLCPDCAAGDWCT
jgi:hypothetical protein